MLKVTFSEFFKNEAFGGDNLGSQRGGQVGCPEQASFNMGVQRGAK